MNEPRKVPFGEISWADDAPGIRAREVEVGVARRATVEYAEGVGREEWCEDDHSGFVLSGGIEYEFDDGRPPLRAAEGEAFLLPPAFSQRRAAGPQPCAGGDAALPHRRSDGGVR